MKFSDLEFRERSTISGIQATVHFDNGYGASVVQGLGTYGEEQGLYEMAVLNANGLCYDTPITDDVLGYLTEDDVSRILGEIEALPVAATGAA